MRTFMKGLLLLLAYAGFYLWSNWTGNEQEEIIVEGGGSMGAHAFTESVSEEDGGELKKFYQIHDTVCEDVQKKYETLLYSLDNYLQRYISLFLITSNLIDYKINNVEEDIAIDLEITISGKDLAFLQDYSKSEDKSSHMRNLSKLDAIFSKIARLKQRSYMEGLGRHSYSFLISSLYFLFSNPSFQHHLPFLIIFLVTALAYYFIFKKPLICFGMFINSMFVWESFNLYRKKLKEADLDIYVKSLQLKDIPEDCDPANQKWYSAILSFVTPNKCLQYYQNVHKTAAEEVSLLDCLLETYGFYLVQTPAKIFGASIRVFSGEVSELWPWPLKHFASVSLVPFFVVLAVIFVLIFCGKRLRLSFLGAALEVGDVNPATGNTKTAINYDSGSGCREAPKPVRDIRKLRPWTKARLNRRSDLLFGMRGRLSVKALRARIGLPERFAEAFERSTGNANSAGSEADVKTNEKRSTEVSVFEGGGASLAGAAGD